MKYVQLYLDNCPYKEYFISGVYNEMIKDGRIIKSFNTDFRLSFGTPEEYNSVKDSNLFAEI